MADRAVRTGVTSRRTRSQPPLPGIDAGELLSWGSSHRRDLPWRRTRDPWLVLVSEVMLQQTQVDRVVTTFLDFCDRYPTPADMAVVPLSDVVRRWQGLGYPRRARYLHTTAVTVAERFDGVVPDRTEALIALPGVGPYTARAVQAFAFGASVGVVDTNVGRVLARWSGSRLRPSAAQAMADALVPVRKGWVWNQSILDFAAAVCTKRSPSCSECILREGCAWAGVGEDPAVGSAAVSRSQAPFEGSLRQARGVLLSRLSDGPCPVQEASVPAAESLAADGLIVRRGGDWELSD